MPTKVNYFIVIKYFDLNAIECKGNTVIIHPIQDVLFIHSINVYYASAEMCAKELNKQF